MRKMDEMEMSISLKAIRIAWFYTIIFLFVWTIYDQVQNNVRGLAFFLLITQNIILIGTQIFLKGRMNKNEE